MNPRGVATLIIVAAIFCVPPVSSVEANAADLLAREVHLSDLPAGIRDAVERAAPESSSERELLFVIDRLVPKRRFESDVVAIVTDLRWYAEAVDGDTRGPVAVLHRWPGDTVLALYALDPAFDEGWVPPLPVETSPVCVTGKTGRLEWFGTLTTEFGEQPWWWIVRSVGDDLPRLGALVLPGDAGLGPEATLALVEEARWVAERVEVRGREWASLSYVKSGQRVLIPPIREVPGRKNERSEPWQVVSTSAFTIGLPPGIRAMRLDAGVHAPHHPTGALLWLRGRFEDIEGSSVVVGDGSRAGYVARLEASAKAWRSGKHAPLGAPGATRVALRGFSLAAERTGARSATAERWSEPGFDGEWLVFRLAFKNEGYEIGLPVLEGRQSPSLFWIAPGWRHAGIPPAPAPHDFEDRFGIQFLPLTSQAGNVPLIPGGILEMPGLVLRVPGGVLPEPALYSEHGYPIRFVSADGKLLGTLSFTDRTEVVTLVAPGAGLTEMEKTDRHDADRVLANDEGWRLFVTTEGDVYSFQPAPGLAAPGKTDDDPAYPARKSWDEILHSVRLTGELRSD